MKTLLLVDIQNDFLPGGALPISEGNHIIPYIKELVNAPFDLIVATKDWHPNNHGSFAENYHKKPGEHVNLSGIDQILWPKHCIQGTWGAEFAAGWDTSRIDKVIYKGTEPNIDSYSTFFDNQHLKSTHLEDYLKEKSVKQIYIAGLATDYCVKYSVLDALHLGFEPYVIVEACRGVNINPRDSEVALQKMSQAGAKLISFSDLMNEMTKEI